MSVARFSLLLVSLFAAVLEAGARPPNIVVFFVDDMGWGDVGFNNPSTTETPLIDALAKEALVFTDMHAGASVCTPSRAALLTGRLGLRTGVHDNFGPTSLYGMPTNETIIAEYLSEAGYYTAGFGKWHLGYKAPYHPSYRFDYYLGTPYSLDMGCTDNPGDKLPAMSPCPQDSAFAELDETEFTTLSGLPASAASGENEFLWTDEVPIGALDNQYVGDYPPGSRTALSLFESTRNCSGHLCDQDIIEQPVNLTTLTSNIVNRVKTQVRIAQSKKKPLFLYIPFPHVHVPLDNARKYDNTSSRGVFGDVLVELDHAVDSIVKTLKQTGEYENSLIIFTGDNGPWENQCDLAGNTAQFQGKWQASKGGGGSTGKFTTWEGGHREPFFALWPNVITPGVTDALASHLDLLPTFMELAGATLPDDRSFDGVDLSPILFGSKTKVREFLFHPDNHAGELGAMRYNELKIFFRTGSDESCEGITGEDIVHFIPLAFNLTADPAESKPIFLNADTLLTVENAMAAKLNDIATTPRSVANYTSGGFYDGPCCDPLRVVCRCANDATTAEGSSLF